MFTGIVGGKAEIVALVERTGLKTLRLAIAAELRDGLELGASVSVDGVCLTVASLEEECVSFDVMMETLSRTTLGDASIGDWLNIERSARQGDEIGGHLISGHIDDTARIVDIETPENNYVLTVELDSRWMKCIFSKGYIALNGASLTVCNVDKAAGQFQIFLIPETLRMTTFGMKQVGQRLNFELDRQTQILVDTVETFLQERLGHLLDQEDISETAARATNMKLLKND